ncbi:MAG: hypothetical protein WCJ26_11535 [bacterium]
MRKKIQTIILSGFILVVPQFLSGQGVIVKQGGYIRVPAGNILNVKDDLILQGSRALYDHGLVKVGGDLRELASSPLNIETGRVVLNGSTPQSVSGTIIFDNLAIDNAAGVSLNHDIAVNKTLTLSGGNLVLGSHNLLLGPDAKFSGVPSGTSMVVATGSGQLRKQFAAPGTFTFPVGDITGGADYTPVVLDFTSATFGAENYVGLNLVNAKYPSPNIQGDYLNRYWEIGSSNISGFTCDAQFFYKASDVTGTESKLYCERVDPPPVAAYDGADVANHMLTATALTTFGTFTGAGAPCYTLQPTAYAAHDVSCFAGADGTVTVSVSGGTGSYTCQWSTTPVQTGTSATGLAAGTYTVTVTDALSCTATSGVTLTQPAQWWPAAPTGEANPCQNTASLYTAADGKSNYVWVISAGGSIVSGGTSTDHTVSVLWNAAGAQSVGVKYTENTSPFCAAVDPGTENVTVKPAPATVISGATTVTQGQVVTYSTPYVSGDTYTWNASHGNPELCFPNRNCLTLTWDFPCGVINPGYVKVTETNPTNGCSETFNLPVTINP